MSGSAAASTWQAASRARIELLDSCHLPLITRERRRARDDGASSNPHLSPMVHVTPRTAYVHIPKVGSTSLRRYVTQVLNGTDHGKDSPSLRHVAFVRHPLDRFLSAALEATEAPDRMKDGWFYREHVEALRPLLRALGRGRERAMSADDLASAWRRLPARLRFSRFAEHYLAGKVNHSAPGADLVRQHMIPQTSILRHCAPGPVARQPTRRSETRAHARRLIRRDLARHRPHGGAAAGLFRFDGDHAGGTRHAREYGGGGEKQVPR